MFIFAHTLLFLDREYDHIVLVHYRETSEVSFQNMISDKHNMVLAAYYECEKVGIPFVQHISLSYTPTLFLKTKIKL